MNADAEIDAVRELLADAGVWFGEGSSGAGIDAIVDIVRPYVEECASLRRRIECVEQIAATSDGMMNTINRLQGEADDARAELELIRRTIPAEYRSDKLHLSIAAILGEMDGMRGSSVDVPNRKRRLRP